MEGVDWAGASSVTASNTLAGRPTEAYLLGLTGLEGFFEYFHGSRWIHIFPLGPHHEGEQVPQLLHEGQVPVLLLTATQ